MLLALYDAVWHCMMLHVETYMLYTVCTHMMIHSVCVSPTLNIVSEPDPQKTTLNTGSAVWCFEHCNPVKVLTGVLVPSSSTTAIVICSTNVTASDDSCGMRTGNEARTATHCAWWNAWQQISLCSYLHKNDIVHGNLSLASIFIQHNGLVKIGSGDPVAVTIVTYSWCFHSN